MKDQALPVVFLVGLIAGFTLVHPACQTESVPMPTPTPDVAASSSGQGGAPGCRPEGFVCCGPGGAEVPPECHEGHEVCTEGWRTGVHGECPLGAGGGATASQAASSASAGGAGSSVSSAASSGSGGVGGASGCVPPCSGLETCCPDGTCKIACL
jgi:hypothetical protein